jgi:predicted Zn-dependent protease
MHTLTKISRLILLAVLLTACANTTNRGTVGVERKQFMMFSERQVESMSLRSYMQTLQTAQKKNTLNNNQAVVERVRRISNRLIAQTPVFRADAASWKWEVNVETNDQVNAYCMPGGKIMVFTGLIDKLNASDDELAAVIGHEISHALREHGRERMSLAAVQSGGVAIIAALMSSSKNQTAAGAAVQAAAMGSQLFFALPNSRTQETEADRMGLELSARAGFDPNAAISLWEKMGKQGEKKPPEFLSTHPSDATRMSDLRRLIPSVMPLYEQAKQKS